MTDDGVRWITDVREEWARFRVHFEGGVLDASKVTPGARALGLASVTVPDGELAKVEGLESLTINGGSAERIDLRGCTSLRQLMISHVRGLTELVGIEELTTLEELDLYALPQIQSVPPLGRMTHLWRLDLGSLKGLTTGLAPFLAVPNLREVQLASTFTIAPGDADLLSDHARMVGFSWWEPKGTPAADLRGLFELAGRRPARRRQDGPPPEDEVPLQPSTDLAPERMVLIHVICRGEWGYGDVYPICDLGAVLLEGEHDYGPGLRLIRITLWQGTKRPEKARLRLQRTKGVLEIEVPSDLSEDQFQADVGPAQFEQGAREVVAALEAARARVAKELPEFAVDRLLDRVRDTSRRLPVTPEDVAEVVDDAVLQVRTLRAAMARRDRAASEPQP